MKTFKAAYVNLLKTSIGSGILSFPLLFHTYGIVPAVGLTVLSGFFASIGLILLAICAQEIGRTADLSSLASLSIPYARPMVNIAVFVKCFGVSLSYLIITKQLLPDFIDAIFGPTRIADKPWLPLLLFLLVVAPFTYCHRLDRLKYTSFLGVICIAMVVIASAYRYCHQTLHATAAEWVVAPSSAWLGSMGKFVFSFTCHQNIFSANAEMKDNSMARMRQLIYSVASTAFILYMGFGLFNYLLYGPAIRDNALRNYPADYLAAAVRGLYVIVMGVSYPLQMVPARKYFVNMAHITPDSNLYGLCHIVATTLMLLSTYLIAISGVNLGIVYTLVGATASTFVCLILPTLFYLHMDLERKPYLVISGYCAFLFGIFVFIATIFGVATTSQK